MLRDKSRKASLFGKCIVQGKGKERGGWREGGKEACALFIKSVRGYTVEMQLCLPRDACSQPALHRKVFPSRKAENTFCDTGKH